MTHADENEDNKIAMLVSMGFDAFASRDSLVKNKGDLEGAIDYLLMSENDTNAVEAPQSEDTDVDNRVNASSGGCPLQEQSFNSIPMGRQTLEAYCLYLNKSDDVQAAKSLGDDTNTEESIAQDSVSEKESIFHSDHGKMRDGKALINGAAAPSNQVFKEVPMHTKLVQSSAKDESVGNVSSHSGGNEQTEPDLKGSKATTFLEPFHGESTRDHKPLEADNSELSEQAPNTSEFVPNDSDVSQEDTKTRVPHDDKRVETTLDESWNEQNEQALVARSSGIETALDDSVTNSRNFDDLSKKESLKEPTERVLTLSEVVSNYDASGSSETETSDPNGNNVERTNKMIDEISDEQKEKYIRVFTDPAEDLTMPIESEREIDDLVSIERSKNILNYKLTSLEPPVQPGSVKLCELGGKDVIENGCNHETPSKNENLIGLPSDSIEIEAGIDAYPCMQRENITHDLNAISHDMNLLSSNAIRNTGDDAGNQENELDCCDQVENNLISLETVPCDGVPLPAEMVAHIQEDDVTDGKKECYDNIVETIRCDEAPLPAEMTVTISNDHVTKQKEAEHSKFCQGESNQSRRSIDPPADFDFVPYQNIFPSSYSDVHRRKKVLLEKLHLAGIAVPASSFAKNDPASGATTAEIDSSVSSFPSDCTTSLGQSTEEDPAPSTDYTVQSSHLPESVSDQATSTSENQYEPPDFIRLNATRVDPTPIYNAVVVPAQTMQPETQSCHDEGNSSIDDSEVGTSIALNDSSITQQQNSAEQLKVPWWKKYKMRAITAILVISLCGMTTALAATMTQQKKKSDNISSKSVGFSSNQGSPEVRPDNTNLISAAPDPSPQPSTLSFEIAVSQTPFEEVILPTQVPAKIATIQKETVSESSIDSSNLDSLPPQQKIEEVSLIPSTSPSAEQPTKSQNLQNSGNPLTLDTTENPTSSPSLEPSYPPSTTPTTDPSKIPSELPSEYPSSNPTDSPSQLPSIAPTNSQSQSPSHIPTEQLTEPPTTTPTEYPSHTPTNTPTQCIPCYWSDVWSKWSECPSVCDGVKTRTRNCICDPQACPGWCEGSETEEAPCNESHGRIRFKTQDVICSDWSGCWLHVNNDEMQASDGHYTNFQQCGDGYLSIEGTEQCLEASGATKCNQSLCQEWRIITVGDYFFQIKNICDDCCLDANSRRRLGTFGEQKIVTCSRCDTFDDGQRWVTWDSPAICGAEPCNIFPPPTRRPTLSTNFVTDAGANTATYPYTNPSTDLSTNA